MKQLIYILITVCLFSLKSVSQSNQTKFMLGGGVSFNGTGDALGYAVLNEIDISIGKRFFLSPGIQLNTHSKTENINVYQLRYVTSGLNLFTNINYKILNKSRHQVALGVGPVLRLQTASEPSTVYYSTTPMGEPMLTLKYDDPIKTLSVGYNIMPSYYYTISKKLFAGAKGVLQNDTRGDVISSAFLFFGVNL